VWGMIKLNIAMTLLDWLMSLIPKEGVKNETYCKCITKVIELSFLLNIAFDECLDEWHRRWEIGRWRR